MTQSDPAGVADCKTCEGVGWVCENHTDQPWGGMSASTRACNCGGAGQPCDGCNTGLQLTDFESGMAEVLQTDRKAAASIGGWDDVVVANILAGKLDHCDQVQAFARHRLLATAQLEAENAWRDIATAPKVLLERILATNGRFTDIVCFIPREPNDGREGPGWVAHHGDVTPTHWMPIPPLTPAKQEKRNGEG